MSVMVQQVKCKTSKRRERLRDECAAQGFTGIDFANASGGRTKTVTLHLFRKPDDPVTAANVSLMRLADHSSQGITDVQISTSKAAGHEMEISISFVDSAVGAGRGDYRVSLIEIRKLIMDLGKEKTVIFSTHIMQEVQAICSRVLIINKSGLDAALLVDQVHGMRRFKEDDLQQEAHVELGHLNDYLNGRFESNDQQWNVFSMEKLVTDEKFLLAV